MGFGNPCRSDDAVGIYVIEVLQKTCGAHSDISFFDMGTGAFEVLYKLKGHNKIVLVDAVVNSGEVPGTIFKLPAAEVMKAPQDDPMVFLHSLKWDQALSYAKKILREEYPDDISVYLVAIDGTRLEIQLSAAVQSAGDKVVEHIKTDISVYYGQPV